MIEVDLPDGSTVEFPDGTPDAVMERALQQWSNENGFAPDAPVSNEATKGNLPVSWGDTAMDVAKSTGVGLGRGIISIPGLPSDMSDLAQNIVQWGGDKMGYDGKAAGETFAKYNPFGYLPNSNEIQGFVEDNVTGEFYEPKTTLGEYGRTLGEFAPAMLTGPAGIGRKAALTGGAALASETGGQLAREYYPEYEGYARVAGGLLGGTAAAKMANKRDVKGLLDSAPTPQAIKDMKNAAYDDVKNMGIYYTSNDLQNLKAKLAGIRHNKKQIPEIGGIIDEVDDLIAKGGATFEDVDDIRKLAGDLALSSEKPTIRMGSILTKEIDDFFDSQVPSSNPNINPAIVTEKAKTARELGRRNILLDQVGEMDRRSEWYLSGDESGMRNQVKNYGKSNAGKYLTKSEEEAFKKVVNREGLLNLANQAGGRLGGMLSASAAGGAGFMAGGPVTGLLSAGGAGLVNLGVRAATGKYTDSAVNNAKKTIALGRKGQKQLEKVKGKKTPAETGLLGTASVQQGQAPSIKSKGGTLYINPSWKTYNYIKEFGDDPPWSAKKNRGIGGVLGSGQ